MAVRDPGERQGQPAQGPPVHPGEPRREGSRGAPVHPGEPRDPLAVPPPGAAPGEPLDLDRDVDPAHPYRAWQLAPYRRDAGLFEAGLSGRYPGLRGSGSRDPRVRAPGPGPGAGVEREPDRASMLNARIAIVAMIVVGQLWGLMVALNAWLEHHMGQVVLLLGFQLLSFALAVAVWQAGPRDR
ncbi:MAG TPA: hypothetical protein VFX88_15955 [Actinomycetota bacterium]|nr:hypothetical protein [Actinomycetota bacterium]